MPKGPQDQKNPANVLGNTGSLDRPDHQRLWDIGDTVKPIEQTESQAEAP